MSLLRGQPDVSPQVPMPIDRQDDTSVSNTSSAETVVWYYVSSGAWAAAATQAAGTICTAKLTYSGVLNSLGTAVGSYNDTSLSFAAATRAATKVYASEKTLSLMQFMSPTDQIATITPYLTTAGDYIIDHRRGQIWLNSKAQVANDSATYKYATPLTGGGTGDKIDLIKIGGVSVIADDGAFTAGTSTGIVAFGFADETATDSVNEGDCGALRMTLDRKLITSGTYKDDTALTAGDYVNPIAGLADEASTDSVDEGDYGALRMTLNRRLITADCFLEDTAHASGDYGSQVLAVRNDTLAALATTDGDYAPLQVDANGALYTLDSNSAAIKTAVELIDDAVATLGTTTYAEATTKGLTIGAVRNDTLATLADTDNEIAPLQVDANGALYTSTSLSTATAGGQTPFFDADGDNTAQVLKAGAGNLYKINIYNPNAADAFVQLFNVAAGSVVVGTTTPNYVIFVPGQGGAIEDWVQGLTFGTAITYACTTTATGSGDPTTGLTVSAGYI